MLKITDLYWTAGFLDGEGCFTNGQKRYVSIRGYQKNTELLVRLKSLFGGVIYPPAKGCVAHSWILTGPKAAGLMMSLYSILSEKRKQEIRSALERWKTVGWHGKWKETCKNGHSFDGLWHGQRTCSTCNRDRQRLRKTQHKEGPSHESL